MGAELESQRGKYESIKYASIIKIHQGAFRAFLASFQKVYLAKLLMIKKQSLELDLPNDDGVF